MEPDSEWWWEKSNWDAQSWKKWRQLTFPGIPGGPLGPTSPWGEKRTFSLSQFFTAALGARGGPSISPSLLVYLVTFIPFGPNGSLQTPISLWTEAKTTSSQKKLPEGTVGVQFREFSLSNSPPVTDIKKWNLPECPGLPSHLHLQVARGSRLPPVNIIKCVWNSRTETRRSGRWQETHSLPWRTSGPWRPLIPLRRRQTSLNTPETLCTTAGPKGGGTFGPGLPGKPSAPRSPRSPFRDTSNNQEIFTTQTRPSRSFNHWSASI